MKVSNGYTQHTAFAGSLAQAAAGATQLQLPVRATWTAELLVAQ